MGEAGRHVSVAREEADQILSRHQNYGLEKEARILREEGEARRRRREAKAVRADWKAKSLAKKFQKTW